VAEIDFIWNADEQIKLRIAPINTVDTHLASVSSEGIVFLELSYDGFQQQSFPDRNLNLANLEKL
jgi:hypothetical protein